MTKFHMVRATAEVGEDDQYRARTATMRGLGHVRGGDQDEFARNLMFAVTRKAPWTKSIFVTWPEGDRQHINLWPENGRAPFVKVSAALGEDGLFRVDQATMEGLDPVSSETEDDFALKLMVRAARRADSCSANGRAG